MQDVMNLTTLHISRHPTIKSKAHHPNYMYPKTTTTTMSTMFQTFLLLLLLPFLTTADNCNKDDKRALLSIKSAFNNAYHFASWTPTSSCCDWYDIECNPTVPGNSAGSRITDLSIIIDSDITGPIPSVVGDLPFITFLELHKLPNLVGNIPSSITRLTRLSVLLLTWNSLSGPIPFFLSQIPSLTLISLASNLFSGSIPPQLANLPSLTLLALSRNRLTSPIPYEFGNFPKSSPPDLFLTTTTFLTTSPSHSACCNGT